MAGSRRLRARNTFALFFLALLTLTSRPQQPLSPVSPASISPTPPQDTPESATPFRLHVYANLVQVPTLVLSSKEKPLPPIAREKFAISLDSGRIFHPTQMRMEGNDSISLGVLLDAGGDQRKLLEAVAESLSRFAVRQLRSGDSVTLYAVDCKVMRNLLNAPPDSETIKSGVAHLLTAPGLHGEKTKPACGHDLHLWNAVVYAANALGKLPGRRVLLIVSAGNEANSTVGLQAASEFLTNRAVAVFGMRDPDEMLMNMTYTSVPGRNFGSMQTPSPNSSASYRENPLDLLCAQNGGIVLKARPDELGNKLDEFATLLRGRYILEFPRPDSGESGMHLITITVPGKSNYVIRSTGVTISLPDPSQINDPNTLHSQPSPATFGPRKVLPPPKH